MKRTQGARVWLLALLYAHMGCCGSEPAAPWHLVVAGKASFMLANALALFPEARQLPVTCATAHAGRQGSGDFRARVAPAWQTSPVLAGEPGVEQLAPLKPDAVLLKSHLHRLSSALARVGINTVGLDFESPAQYTRDLAALGRLLHAEDRAQVLIDYYAGITQSVAAKTQGLPATNKPRALLLQYSARGGTVAFSVPAASWMQTALLELAGGVPIWKEYALGSGWSVVNLEQIAAWNPDIVLVVDYNASASQAVSEIMADPKWQALPAVRQKQVFPFPGDFTSWDQPDTRWGLGLLWMATRLHPELFGHVDMDDEIIRFYSLYGLDETQVRAQIFPLLKADLADAIP